MTRTNELTISFHAVLKKDHFEAVCPKVEKVFIHKSSLTERKSQKSKNTVTVMGLYLADLGLGFIS